VKHYPEQHTDNRNKSREDQYMDATPASFRHIGISGFTRAYQAKLLAPLLSNSKSAERLRVFQPTSSPEAEV
jgi:hypothetical protein